MKKFETRILTEEGAWIVKSNFRWFAGFRYQIKKVGINRYSVRCPRWCWSFIDLRGLE